MKKCSKCGVEKELEFFHKLSRNKDGLNSQCKSCVMTKTHTYRANNPEQYSKTKKKTESKRYGTRREYTKTKVEEFYRRNPDYDKNRWLERKYGLSPEDYGSMLASTGGICQCCGKKFKGKRKPVVDHCHDSGNVRGIICNLCNCAIGYVKEDINTLHGIEKYLLSHL